MIGKKKTTLSLVLFAMIGLCAASVSAGLLDTGTPYTDATRTWRDTTSFDGSMYGNPNLAGTIDWVVFAPGQFPFSGFTPPSDQCSYVYQVNSSGSDHITSYSVYLNNEANNQDSFTDTDNGVSGDPPTGEILTPYTTVEWQFAGIVQDGESEGLVFTSPNTPENAVGLLVNGGSVAFAIPVPAPSSNPIPEPATILSLLIGLCVFAAYRLKR